MKFRTALSIVVMLGALLGLHGCAHYTFGPPSYSSSIQDFGCHGDATSLYAPYCHPTP